MMVVWVQSHNEKSDTDFPELNKAVCSSRDDIVSYENNQTSYPVLLQNIGQELGIGFASYGNLKSALLDPQSTAGTSIVLQL